MAWHLCARVDTGIIVDRIKLSRCQTIRRLVLPVKVAWIRMKIRYIIDTRGKVNTFKRYVSLRGSRGKKPSKGVNRATVCQTLSPYLQLRCRYPCANKHRFSTCKNTHRIHKIPTLISITDLLMNLTFLLIFSNTKNYTRTLDNVKNIRM